MTTFLVAAFYLAVLLLVVRCFVYLWRTRHEAERRYADHRLGSATVRSRPAATSLLALETARQLAGPLRLDELGGVLERLAAAEAWGMIVDLRFTSVPDAAQMILRPSGVDLYSHHLGSFADYRERFEAAAARTGVEPQPAAEAPGELVLVLAGPWHEVAAAVVRLLGEVYGVGPDEPAQLTVFP